MKNLKLFKALSLAVILALLLSCFAGCGDKEKSGAGKSFNKKKPTATESGGSSTASQDDTPDKGDEKDDTKTPSAEDKELEVLKKMTSKQIGDEIFEEAFKVYFLFDGGNLDFENEDTVEKNGNVYYKVTSKQEMFDSSVDFASYKEFVDFVKRYFSKEFTEKLLKDSYYLNVDGELYTIPVGRGGNMSYHSHSFAVTSAKKGEIVYTVYLKNIKEEYMDQMFTDEDFEASEDMLTTTEIKYNYKKIDGKWVFTDFQSLY